MSNNQPPKISGYLTAPPASSTVAVTQQDNTSQAQPRQPTNLQGLLRFAMHATATEDAPSGSQFFPLDEERKQFLESALKSMTIDIIEMLREKIELLQTVDKLTLDSDISSYLQAFDDIVEHIDRIDTAIDFHKIGGFVIFPPSLKCVHPQIRASACDLIAELCQNNPYCQRVISDNNLLQELITLLNQDGNESVQIKALYAISCNIRENPESIEIFLRNNGLEAVCTALQKKSDKLRTKAAFLLSCIANQKKIRDELVAKGSITILAQLISEPRQPSHEHLLNFLWLLIVDNPNAIQICSAPELQLVNVLNKHLDLIKDKDGLEDEIECCSLIHKAINDYLSHSTEPDR